MTAPDATPAKPGERARSRWRSLAIFLVGVVVIDLVAGYFVARPLGIIRRAADPDVVYENTPGDFWGRATYDVWKAPLYMIWDLARGSSSQPRRNAVLYRIDRDGCRVPSAGSPAATADVLMVGSSQAFGMLLPAESSVPMMLERSLQGRGFRGVRVANCSVVGHRFLQTLKMVRRELPLKRPRLAVVLVRPWHMTEPFPYIEVMSPRNRVLNWLIHRSTLVRLGYYFTWHDSPQPNPLSPAAVAAGLDAYARELGGVRSEFFLLDDGQPECDVFDGLVVALRARGFGVHRIRTPSGPRDMFIDADRHWSVRGGQYTTAQLLDPVADALRALDAPHAP